MLKTPCSLPQEPLKIPQPDGSTALILLKACSDPEKKLGVWTCPLGSFGHNVKQMRTKGEAWAQSMRSSKCPPCDAWLGWRHQLYRQMTYGFVDLVHPPNLLEESF